MIKLKRIYESFKRTDGYRILIDRLWPRGVSKEKAHLDLWLKDIAPSTELRKWFGHDPEKWLDFKKKYFKELREHKELIDELKTKARKHTVTLLFAAKDLEHNHAVALKEFLEK